MILGLRVPPGEGFFSPGLVQFEDLEKNVCEVSIVKHAVSVTILSFSRPTTRRYVGLLSFPSPPSSHRASVLLRSNLADAIPSCCLLSCTILI